MPKVIVLGAGMVGSTIARDLIDEDGYQVALADISADNLFNTERKFPGKITTIEADLSDPSQVKRIIEPYDIVLGALASRLGLATLRAVIEAGKPYCDISFMPEDALELDDLAKTNGVTAVVDCGVAPGLSHMMAGYGAAQLDEPQSLEIYVGGLPQERIWPFEYKAGFAPTDVVEEYTRPTRLIEHGKMVMRPALSEPELINLPHVGTVEAFNTDGLRSLVKTLDIPFMKEKTLRYPGHCELMRIFRDSGFFSQEEITCGSVKVRPLDVFSTIVFPQWQYHDGETDLTVMRVVITGLKDGNRIRYTWDLYDQYDPGQRITSMSRTTAFPCALVARLLADKRYNEPGVHPPEHLGADAELFDYVLEGMTSRAVQCKFQEKLLTD